MSIIEILGHVALGATVGGFFLYIVTRLPEGY